MALPALTDGAIRGPIKEFDILENCEIVLKFDVKGRKHPLRINF